MLIWPLKVPFPQRILPDKPGSFGVQRKFDIHTGVDLYCGLGTPVQAMESGEVVGIEAFTGDICPGEDASPWWNNTLALLVRGDYTGTIYVYGEVSPDSLRVGLHERVEQGQDLARINVPVLKSFKGRPMVMLHLEMYSCLPEGYQGRWFKEDDIPATMWWKRDKNHPERLLDPTPLLQPLAHSHFDLSEYDGLWAMDPSAVRKPAKWYEVWGGHP